MVVQHSEFPAIESPARDSESRFVGDGMELRGVSGAPIVPEQLVRSAADLGRAHEHSRDGALFLGVGSGSVVGLSHQFGVPALQCTLCCNTLDRR